LFVRKSLKAELVRWEGLVSHDIRKHLSGHFSGVVVFVIGIESGATRLQPIMSEQIMQNIDLRVLREALVIILGRAPFQAFS